VDRVKTIRSGMFLSNGSGREIGLHAFGKLLPGFMTSKVLFESAAKCLLSYYFIFSFL
jgi:hypothetical protein